MLIDLAAMLIFIAAIQACTTTMQINIVKM
jgi:hypothetical protein